MDNVVTTILSNAGFAGALLIVVGWAYWKKDRSDKAGQMALTTQAENHGKQIKSLQDEFIAKLDELSEKRVADAKEYARQLKEIGDQQAQAVSEVAVTNTEVKAVLLEVRRDIRDRNRRPPSHAGFDPTGGEG